MDSVLKSSINYNSGNKLSTDMSGANSSLKFLNNNSNSENRNEYEDKYSALESDTNIEEGNLNSANDTFKSANVSRNIRKREIKDILLSIETLKYDKERLKKYVVDGESAYKFEVNKVWVYTLFNVGGCAAMIYMLL